MRLKKPTDDAESPGITDHLATTSAVQIREDRGQHSHVNAISPYISMSTLSPCTPAFHS